MRARTTKVSCKLRRQEPFVAIRSAHVPSATSSDIFNGASGLSARGSGGH